MKPDQYFIPKPTKYLVDALSDPQLNLEKHRDQIDPLILSLCIRYLADYLSIQSEDIYQIRDIILTAVMQSNQDVSPYLMEQLSGHKPLLDPRDKANSLFYKTDFFALQCASDIKSTAAILMEIIFASRFELSADKEALIMDHGHGTGILMLGGYIAAKRRGATEVICMGFDTQSQAVERSHHALDKAVPGSTRVLHIDARHPGLKAYYESGLLNFWISETISLSTPEMIVENNNIIIERDGLTALALQTSGDTFPYILEATLQNMPNFEQKVKGGEMAMFPDLINGKYRPGLIPTLFLETIKEPKAVGLSFIGNQFDHFEDLGSDKNRW